MAIPDYQTIMLPLLQCTADQKEHSLKETIEELSDKFNLTEAEKYELLPSGTQGRFANRVAWARSYLKQAGLVENPSRGVFQITTRGRQVLNEKPPKIDSKYLLKFEEFIDFRNRSQDQKESGKNEEIEDLERTPLEVIEEGYQKINDELKSELLSKVKKCTPRFFEEMVIELLFRMGYGGTREDAMAVGRSGDGGIDGIIKEDKLGLDAIYIQAKKWDGSVGSKEIRNFVGSLVGQKANKGVFITTSTFTKDALEYVKSVQHKVVLIDGDELTRLMIKNNVGVAENNAYVIKKIDGDFFLEE